MYKTLTVKERDWSLNLEDVYYVEHPEEILPECLTGAAKTAPGCYVNIVTPGECGDPHQWLIPQLTAKLEEAGISFKEIRYIDQCGCGGHVIRVFR